MQPAERLRARTAATAAASALGLPVNRTVVLSDSNRLVVRLLPCDAVARIAPIGYRVFPAAVGAERELDLVRRLAEANGPVGPLDPRVDPSVIVQDGFEIALLAYVEAGDPLAVSPRAYAHALMHLHGGMRQIDVAIPRLADRVSDVQRWVVCRDDTPDLSDEDRQILVTTLDGLWQSIVDRDPPEQLLHGEPHLWNLLNSEEGPLFVDFENCVSGPLEFDLGWVPKVVSECYQNVDQQLVEDCRGLVLAIVAAHGWRLSDHKPGREAGAAFLDAVRKGPPWPSLDAV